MHGVVDRQARVDLPAWAIFLRNLIVFLGTPIDDVVANLIVAQLLYLSQDDPEREIQMCISNEKMS